MSKIEVDTVVPKSGTTITIGESGDTVALGSGATQTGFGTANIDDNGTATAITIDSSNNVGIGTSSPNSVEAGFNGITFNGSSGSFADFESNGNHYGRIITSSSGNFSIQNPSANATTFTINGSERMRINSSGNVLIGRTTDSVNASQLQVKSQCVETDADTTGIHFNRTDSNSAWVATRFKIQNSTKGFIQVNPTNTTYSTTSDYRLKENVIDLADATTRVKQLQPKRFNFIAYADTTVDGFLAHEVSDIVPEAITGTKDEVDADGNPVYQGIDQSKLVPLLTASLKEAIAKIEELETRLEALENV